MERYFVISFLFCLLTSSCNILGEPKNELIKEDSDCNSEYKAVLFLQYAGATSDNSIQLSIIKKHQKLNNKMIGNIFTADSDHGRTVIDNSRASFEWLSCDTLRVTYDSRLRIFKQQAIYKDFVIIYKTN
jgi:hypothetical protein